MPAEITRDVTVVDIEIELPDGSTVWLEPKTGLNVIYGKNGAGKTFFLRAITSGRCAGVIYLRLAEAPPSEDFPKSFGVLDIIAQGINNLRRHPEFASPFRGRFHSYMFLPPTASELWSQIDIETQRFRLYGREGMARFSQYRLTEKGKSLLVEEIHKRLENPIALKLEIDPFSDIPIDEWLNDGQWITYREEYATVSNVAITEINEVGVLPHYVVHSETNSLATTIRSALEKNLYLDIRDIEFGAKGGHYVMGSLRFLEVERRLPKDLSKFRQEVPYQDLALDETMAHLTSWYLKEFLDQALLTLQHQPWEPEPYDWFERIHYGNRERLKDLIEGESQEILRIFQGALLELLDDRFVAVARDPNLRDSSNSSLQFRTGIPHYAIRLPDSASPSPTSETDKFFAHILNFFDEFHSDSKDLSHSGLIGSIFLHAMGEDPVAGYHGVARLNRHQQRKRYLRVRPRFGNELSDAPGIVNLDSPVDLSAIASSLMDIATAGGAWIISPPSDKSPLGEVNVDLPNQPSVNLMIEFASGILRGFDIGISEIVFDFKSDYDSLRVREQPEIRFRTVGDNQSIDFAELSSAQQRWATLLFNILLNEPSRERSLLFVADEPDSGVHQSASREILEFLASQPCTSLITSHSPTSLRIDTAHLVHLSVAPDGERTASPPALSKTVAEVATDLGVSPVELLALRKLLVVCEGDHDVAVIEGLIGCSRVSGIQQRVIVAAARGVANLQSTAACSIVTDYTDLKVLHVADNSNLEELKKISDYLRACPKNMSTAKALQNSGLLARRIIATAEDIVMLNLLEAIAKRQLLSRFHLFGLRKKDIVEYLPEISFGLTDSWTQLRGDYYRFKGAEQLNFKEWLRAERSAQISTRKVREAFANQATLHQDLRALLDEIEYLAISMSTKENT